MCTLMVLYRAPPEFWLIAAANRDERLDRPSAPPGILRENPRAVGGKDLVAGGTWLGLNAYRLFAAVTNRRDGAPDPARRSRGLLALDALGCARAPAAASCAAEAAARHNPFNLVLLDPREGVVVAYDGHGKWSRPVEPGPVVLTNGDPNDTRIGNVARGLHILRELARAPEAELIRRLAEACADHTPESPEHPPFCVHGDLFGTVSSTILLLREDGSGRYLFAPGPPCVTAYQDYTPLVREVAA